MLGRLIILFVSVGFVEMALLIETGRWLGTLATVGLVVLTGVVGATMARMQGLKVLNDLKFDLSVGNVPTDNIVSGVLVLASGLLLLTPGLLTDAIGFLVLVPPIREKLVKALVRYAARKIKIL